MKDYIEERVLELAHYIINTNSTVRSTAKKFRVSKSTVHKDVTERLLEINPGLASEELKLEDKEYFVLGDNRGVSQDSRIIGLISKKDICGVGVFRLFPLNKIGVVK